MCSDYDDRIKLKFGGKIPDGHWQEDEGYMESFL